MKSKRVLELKEFEKQHKQRKLELEEAAAEHIRQLKEEVEKVERALHQYVKQEFVHYVKRASTLVQNVTGGTPGLYVYVWFNNGCRFQIPPPGEEDYDAVLTFNKDICLRMFSGQRSVMPHFLESDERVNERLVRCAEVFADASRLFREVVPRWFGAVLPELDV